MAKGWRVIWEKNKCVTYDNSLNLAVIRDQFGITRNPVLLLRAVIRDSEQ